MILNSHDDPIKIRRLNMHTGTTTYVGQELHADGLMGIITKLIKLMLHSTSNGIVKISKQTSDVFDR
jgi:hypothetical protein